MDPHQLRRAERGAPAALGAGTLNLRFGYTDAAGNPNFGVLNIAGERAAIRAVPGVEELRDLAPPLSLGVTSLATAAIGLLPQRLRYSMPVIAILQARFRGLSDRPS